MWNGSRRAILAALTLAAVSATQALAAQSNSGSEIVYCHNDPGFIDLPPPIILLTYTSRGKVRFGYRFFDLGAVVDGETLARNLDAAADADPLPTIEIQSERSDAEISTVLPLIRLARDHKLTHVWIDAFYPAHADPSSRGPGAGLPPYSKMIFCTLGQNPATSDLITLAVSMAGSISWNGEPIRTSDLQNRLARAAKRGRPPTIHVIADPHTSMQRVTDVLLALKMNRIEWFQLSTK